MGMCPHCSEVVVPEHPVGDYQCASDLAGTGISETLVPRMVDPCRSPEFGPSKCPRGKNSLCTLTTASRARMALRLGFCFQLSSERGSTYRDIPSGTPDSASENRHELSARSVTSEDAGPRPDPGGSHCAACQTLPRETRPTPTPAHVVFPGVSHNRGSQAHLHR